MITYQPLWAEPVWKTNRKRWKNSLHSMCSYLAMFPPSLPNYFIKQFTEEGDVVFDPFSGRGTTSLEASLNNRIGIGNDLNPLAKVLTGAKVNIPRLENILYRIEQLRLNYIKTDISHVEDDIKMLYDEEITLPMLVYLKISLNIKNKVDRFIMGILLGIMHGKHRKDGTSIYLSISMPNTFSMSPDYVRKYIEEKNLKKIKQNVFELLRQRVISLYPYKTEFTEGKFYGRDAITICRDKRIFCEDSIDLIFTSPPYLKLIRYGKYNWIRLWMLGENTEEIDEDLKINKAYESGSDIKLSDRLQLDEYLIFIKKLVIGWERILKQNSLAFIVIGDVGELNLCQNVWDYIKNYTKLNLVTIIDDNIEGNQKVTKIWGKERKGDATKIERILVLSKGIPKAPNYTYNLKEEFNYFRV